MKLNLSLASQATPSFATLKKLGVAWLANLK